MNHPTAEDDRRSTHEVSDAPSPRSKFANRKRKDRVRGYGEGTVYEFERRLRAGAVWRGYRAKRSIKHGERSIRVVGQGKTRQEALANLERNITRTRIALAELAQSYIRSTVLKSCGYFGERWFLAPLTAGSLMISSHPALTSCFSCTLAP